jgi:hypothetical protein
MPACCAPTYQCPRHVLRTAVFLSTAQGQLATIQESFHAPAAAHTATAALETSVVSEAGADDSIIA